MSWPPGTLVICIDDDFGGDDCGEVFPVKGVVYTVRDIDPEDAECIWLVEIVNEPQEYEDGYGEASFWDARFRPITTDQLEVFRSILRKAPAKQGEPVE